jgi:hypothetical protein
MTGRRRTHGVVKLAEPIPVRGHATIASVAFGLSLEITLLRPKRASHLGVFDLVQTPLGQPYHRLTMSGSTASGAVGAGTGHALAQAACRFRIDRATAEACVAFADYGIHAILLKGPATARVLYQHDERFYCDADILVAPQQRGLAGAVLEELGFAESAPTTSIKRWTARQMEGKDRTFVRLSDRVSVELHRSFHLMPIATDFYRVLAAHQEVITLAGASLAVPNRAAVGLLCLLHAKTASLEGAPTQRLRSDLLRAIEQLTDEEWDEAAAIAREVGAESYCVAVLIEQGGLTGPALAHRLFPGIRADRLLTAHLRTGSVMAYKSINFKHRTWKSRLVWCLTRLLPFAQPPITDREQATIDAWNRSGPSWALFDLVGALRTKGR